MMCNIMILLFCSDRYLMVKSPFVGASLLCFLCMVNLPSSPITVCSHQSMATGERPWQITHRRCRSDILPEWLRIYQIHVSGTRFLQYVLLHMFFILISPVYNTHYFLSFFHAQVELQISCILQTDPSGEGAAHEHRGVQSRCGNSLQFQHPPSHLF